MKPLVTILSWFGLIAAVLALNGCSQQQSQAVAHYEHAADSAYAAAISEDGHYAVVSTVYHGLAFWDIEKNALQYQWSHQGSENNQVLVTAIASDNSHVLTADRDNFALWDVATGLSKGFIKLKDSNIRDVAISNGGQHILIGKSNGVVVHITTETGRRIEFLGHQEKINSVAMSDNGRYALTGSNDYVAYLWDTETGQVIHRFNHPSRVTKVALDPTRRYAFTADSQKQAQVWDLVTGKPISRLNFTSRHKVFSAARFNHDGTLLATGSPSRQLILWDVKTGEQLQSWVVAPKKDSRPQSAVVHAVAFINNDTQLLSESSSGLLEVWEIDKKR